MAQSDATAAFRLPSHFFEVPATDGGQSIKLAYRIYTAPDGRLSDKSVIDTDFKVTPVVLVQGWTGVKEDWMGLPRELARDRYVLVFDNRGMGQSDVPTDMFTLDDCARDVLALCRHVFPRARRMNVMGISMGGMITQLATLQSAAAGDHYVERAILGCTWSGGRTKIVSKSMQNEFLAATRELQRLSQEGKDKTGKGADRMSPEFRAALEKMVGLNYTPKWIKENPSLWATAMALSLGGRRPAKGMALQGAALAQFDVAETVGSLSIPVSIIHGTEDAVIDYGNAELLHKNLTADPQRHHSSNQLITLQSAGHVFWQMEPAATAEAIRAFLRSDASPAVKSRL